MHSVEKRHPKKGDLIIVKKIGRANSGVNSTFFQSFRGINFIESDYNLKIRFEKLIISYLGHRNINAQCSYADLIKTIFYNHAIGSDVLDDENTSRLCVNVVSFLLLIIIRWITIATSFQTLKLIMPIIIKG